MNKRRFIKLLSGVPLLPSVMARSAFIPLMIGPNKVINDTWVDAGYGSWAFTQTYQSNLQRFTVDSTGTFIAVKNEPNNGQK